MKTRFLTSTLIAGFFGASLCVAHADTSSVNRSDSLIKTINLAASTDPYIDEISVPKGKSVVLRFDVPISEATVGDPETADIVPLTDRSIYVLGKGQGATNVTLVGSGQRILGVIDVNVSYDTTGLKKRLHDMLPGEPIEVRTSGETIMLSGKVSGTDVVSRAMDIANTFAPDKVLNAMTLGGSQQVMLEVRFAEVERNAAKALGISANATTGQTLVNPLDPNGLLIQEGLLSNLINPAAVSTSSFARLADTFDVGNLTIDLVLDALEQRGMASILAEPTLIAVSGEEASFLAGGEFPIPVSSSNDSGALQVQVEFKEFGVRLGFTPTVIGDTIALDVTPEVSELDRQSGVELEGISIPGLKTRRVTTSVELKNGQSFAIAGPIQKSFLDSLDQLPGFGNIPILGALGRSANFEREETELAIIVTPYIVEPDESGDLALPTDFYTRPHEFELFFLGKTESNDGRDVFGNPVTANRNLTSRLMASRTSSKPIVGYIVE